MKAMKTTMGIATVAVALVAALAVPAAALAETAPVVPGSTTSSPTVRPKKAQIRKYRALSRARYNRFKADIKVINRRLNRLSAIASRVESRGADVTQVRDEIAQARVHVAAAKTLASDAAAKLKAVPYAADRRAALAEANAAFRAASAELKAARADKKAAAAHLWVLVKQVRLARSYSSAEFK